MEQFDGGPLDLVVDDCSHLYEPTRASFNELFPRLRPGGAYVIEDWVWAHTPLDSEHPEGLLPNGCRSLAWCSRSSSPYPRCPV
jgi:hypothetical protein